jgi:hypothetical protein
MFFWGRPAPPRKENICKEILRQQGNIFLQILTLRVSFKNLVTPGIWEREIG